jgi:hypothetical protein
MNKAINILLFGSLGVFCFMVMVTVFDLSISSLHLRGMPYRREIFTTFAGLVLLIGLLRIKRRWQGMRDMKNYAEFDVSWPVAKGHLNHGITITSVEIFFMLAGISFCFLVMPLEPTYVLPMIIVLALLCLESFYFILQLFKGGKAFRVGINNNVVALFDREMQLFYYDGLEKVELHQDDLINFSYREDLNLPFQTASLRGEDREAFKDALIKQLSEHQIFVDSTLRNWK